MIDIKDLSKISSVGLSNGHIVSATGNSVVSHSSDPSTFIITNAHVADGNNIRIGSDVTIYIKREDVSWYIYRSKN